MSILDRPAFGLLAPLFSLRSGRGWGVGELPDIPRFAPFARECGASFLMTLPLLEPSPGLESPYSAGSFFALDPLYLALDELEPFGAIGGRQKLPAEDRAALEDVEAAPFVLHGAVRALKDRVLRRAHTHFLATADAASAPARDLAAFRDEHRAWLPDYALFRALKHRLPQSWKSWPEGVRTRHEPSVEDARRELHDEVEHRTWLQWLTFRQLEAARKEARAAGLALVGDEPFLVAEDSADVWQLQHLFRFDATVGAPPDAFSAEGQEWGLPPYRWDRIAESGYELFRQRGAHVARFFDAVRIDHVVGLYRTYHRPLDKSRPHFFFPEGQPAQLAQGEAALRAFASGGAALVAEDLGVIPDFVRSSLDRLAIPGYRVLRWEAENGRYRDPKKFPAVSIATTGTHDTETSIEWWEKLDEFDRLAFGALPGMSALAKKERFDEDVWRALLALSFGAASRTVLLPIFDVLALRQRVNTPNTMGPENWSTRLPWTFETLASDAIVRGRARFVRGLSEKTGRTP